MKNTLRSLTALKSLPGELKTGEKPVTEREAIHWEIEVTGFKIISPKRRGVWQSRIELYSGDETLVGILDFYRDAENIPCDCLSMGCVHGYCHESLYRHYVDILNSFDDLRLYYIGKLAEGGRCYLQPSEETVVR